MAPVDFTHHLDSTTNILLCFLITYISMQQSTLFFDTFQSKLQIWVHFSLNTSHVQLNVDDHHQVILQRSSTVYIPTSAACLFPTHFVNTGFNKSF